MAGYEERLCTECGTEFKPYQYNQKRCRSCVLKFDRRAEHRVLTKKCPSCEEVFMPRTARQVYCSSHCGEKGHNMAWKEKRSKLYSATVITNVKFVAVKVLS
ncbi:hypothetical protein VpaE1_094 [Escherichia phage vB_EcoM-VpaE1]|uniref:Uncharacterized protein n=1 Tax=Escherichia phage vB_EcoM-VpaE1 TaxID=1555238 RepID=A0A0A0RSE7_9CAUD|nr:hypothetical protein ACQ43_gp084 [Escherichia phage vB_EcoM-VpaE1]AIW02354.1 hypothetical protein VpaE1_094 [Escherichia phage vB_EcoM-VpaE1]